MMIAHRDVKLMLVLTATPWVKEPDPEDAKRTREVRRWVGLAEGEDNLAATVRQAGSFWPFKKWEWHVWSPFEKDSVLDGEAASEEAAATATDDALLALVASVAQT